MKRLILQVVAGVFGLFAASKFVPMAQVNLLPDSRFFGLELTATWQVFLLLGTVLGLLNFFAKPILNLITFPLRIITLGLFCLVINGGLIWALDVIFKEFSAPLLFPLLWTTLIVWGLDMLLLVFIREKS